MGSTGGHGDVRLLVQRNIDPDLLARIDKFRFTRMFPTRTEALECLLDAGLKVKLENPSLAKE